MRVFVYYNLHRKCWSIKALEGERKGKVIAHADRVGLLDCTFKVSAAGRDRVRRERKKYVHAGVVGTLTPGLSIGDTRAHKVVYNPYRYETFVRWVDQSPIHTAAQVYMECYTNGTTGVYV